MTKLLVSVRNRQEAVDALTGGADIIDVKEPRHGSLGRADLATVMAIKETVHQRVPVSMACGELLDWKSTDTCPALNFAKIGLSHCRELGTALVPARSSWPRRWQRWAESLPGDTKPVAVVFADAAKAGSPNPLEIIRESQQLGCQGVLVDTFDKRGSATLLDLHPTTEVVDWLSAARDGDQFFAVAGSLTIASIAEIVPLGVDIIAVRGAACVNQRTSQICTEKVRQLANAVSAASVE